MKLVPQTSHLEDYLAESEMIDWRHELVLQRAQNLARDAQSQTDVAQRCFEFVRDAIQHSWDYRLEVVTCKASDVLREGSGFCYAKSHLLAALLRANGIPAGLCYQRLTIDNDQPPFCLHGLNALYLPDYGWLRVDARGNKAGVDAQFCPPEEKLAFGIVTPGEADLAHIWLEPMPVIIDSLTRAENVAAVAENLPDIRV